MIRAYVVDLFRPQGQQLLLHFATHCRGGSLLATSPRVPKMACLDFVPANDMGIVSCNSLCCQKVLQSPGPAFLFENAVTMCCSCEC